MNLIVFGLIIIIINCIISILLINHLAKEVVKALKIHDETDELLKNSICKIYGIISFNNLKRPKKEEK